MDLTMITQYQVGDDSSFFCPMNASAAPWFFATVAHSAPSLGRFALSPEGTCTTVSDASPLVCMRDVKGKHTRAHLLSAFLRAKRPD
jgi:hypothetical protein